jgi:hypothetical protein
MSDPFSGFSGDDSLGVAEAVAGQPKIVLNVGCGYPARHGLHASFQGSAGARYGSISIRRSIRISSAR